MNLAESIQKVAVRVSSRIRRGLLRRYVLFLERIVVKRVLQPERAIRFACNIITPTPERVISNYGQGMVLFGRHKTNELFWESNPKRAVITSESAHIPRRLKEYMRKGEFEIRYNVNFESSVRASQRERWTWINEPLINIYKELFSMGFGQSIEVYQGEQLVGGLWGFLLGNTFSIQSMFHQVERAGAISLATLVKRLIDGELGMVDCVQQKPNFARYGAHVVSQENFVEMVIRGLVRSGTSRDAEQMLRGQNKKVDVKFDNTSQT
jgi:leucyl/phenylalanyl-tRNA--protein transferase